MDRDREAERVAAEVEAFHRRNRNHLVAEDLRLGMLVSFEHRGERRLGKIAGCGRVGATVLSGYFEKWDEPDPTRRRVPQEVLVPYGLLKAAAWPGAVIATVSGQTIQVTSVKGNNIVGVILTEGPGEGEEGLVWAREVVAVVDDGDFVSAGESSAAPRRVRVRL